MPHRDQTNADGRSPWALVLRKPVALAAAGVIGVGVLAAVALPESTIAVAQTGNLSKTVETPYGRAPLSFADIVEKVRPAVVSIHVQNSSKKQRMSRNFDFRGLPDLPPDHPLNEFFKRFMPDTPGAPDAPNRPGTPRPTMAQGSGFIISADGFVVTNNHVIDEASEIGVTLDDGTKLDAELIGADSRTDLALLKIKDGNRKFAYVEFANDPAKVGDWVLAVGNPFGLGGTVTAGIISAHNRDIGSSPYDYLQIDAAVNRGNSGGPSFNLQGQVIGVNTAIFSPSGGNVGIAFAVPSQLAQQVVQQLREHGSVERGWLGVTIQSVTEDIAESVGLKEPKGAMVTQLAEKGPAVKSELKPGDVIVEVNGEKIDDSRDLARKIAAIRPKAPVDLTVVRDGDRRNVKLSLGTFPSNKELAELRSPTPSAPTKGESMDDLGLKLAPAAEYSGAGENGVVITDVDPDSDAADKGLKAGDVILEVAGQTVSKPSDVAEGVRAAKSKGRTAVLMRVQSGEQKRFVALPLKKA